MAIWYSYCTLTPDSTGAPNCTASFSSNAILAAAQQAQSDNGVVCIMAICAGISAIGAIMTLFFVKETGGKTLEEVDAACVTLAAHDAKAEAEEDALAAKSVTLVVDVDGGASRTDDGITSPSSVQAAESPK